jgi:ribosome-binding factor A
MDQKKDGKIASIVSQSAAEFFKLESDRTSMITVTGVEVTDRGKKAIIFITVLPEEKEQDAIAFSKRRRSDLHKFLIEKTGLAIVPFVDVMIDIGEKNRQHLDSLKIE